MKKNNRTPQIRFKGFTNSWEQHKLAEISEISAGGDIDNSKLCEKGKYPVIANSLTNGGIVGYYKEDYRIKAPAVTVTGRGDIGHAQARYVDFTPVVRLLALQTKYDINFIANAINTKNIIVESTGVPQLTVPQLGNYEIYLTSNTEERKIGNLFVVLDNIITLHQSKCDNLVNVKKSLLEKMFPKNGCDIPEIRFKGFTDRWEHRKIKDIADRYDNLRVPVASNLRVKGNTPYYGANGIQDYVKGYTHNGEFVLVAEDGANDLKNYPVQYVNGYIWANNHVHVLQGKSKIINNKFLKYAISKTNIESLLVGGGRAKLNANIMMDIEIKIPSKIEEQEAIGEYIFKLDNLITLHQHKLEKLRNIKKSLLEKMFV